MHWTRSCAAVTLGCTVAAATAAAAEPPTFDELPTAAEMAFAYEHLRPSSARFHDQEEQAEQVDGRNRETADGQRQSPPPPTNAGMGPVTKGVFIGAVAGFSTGCVIGAAIDTRCAPTGARAAFPGAAIGALVGWLAR